MLTPVYKHETVSGKHNLHLAFYKTYKSMQRKMPNLAHMPDGMAELKRELERCLPHVHVRITLKEEIYAHTIS